MKKTANAIQNWLATAPPALFSCWAVIGAFGTYFCMYAFRKPFAAGTFEGEASLFGLVTMDMKILFVIAQLVGYALSKFIGIKLVSEMDAGRRAMAILIFIGLAELALILFGVVPAPYNAICLFLNGLPLGMIWGLVFAFMEGRKTSDLLGAGLCASFVIASGFVKSIGEVMIPKVGEFWMPAATGALFVIPLLFFVFMLAVLPPPSKEDEAERTRRAPMDGAARKAFLKQYGLGIFALVFGYVVLTAYRDFRDNFAREIWDALGYAGEPSIMTTAEIPVAVGSLLLVAALITVRDSHRALGLIHGAMALGAVGVGGCTFLYQMGVIGPATWMIGVGLGLYIAYIPFNCVLFDRMIAATGSVGTAAFLIYVADSAGYLGSIGLLLYKNFGERDLSWLAFFTSLSYAMALFCFLGFLGGLFYFRRRLPTPAS